MAVGIVGPSDPYVVAINGGLLPDADAEKGIPEIVNAVFGLGEPAIRVPIGGRADHERVVLEDQTVRKANSSVVSTAAFRSRDYSGISGILFSPRRIFDRIPTKVGNDFVFVLNPDANVPLAEHFFRCGRASTLSKDGVHGSRVVTRCSDPATSKSE